MNRPVRIIGNYLSPYVRKVLVCLQLKGIDYEIDPIAPFVGDERFSQISPLRRIPVLIDGDLALNDSSVICQYLEDRQPQPALYPADIAARARARWLEEYADSLLGDVIVWRMFYQVGVKRLLFNEATNEEVVRKAREEELPAALDYLEPQMPESGFLFGDVSIADVAIACFLRNAAFVRYQIDAQRWPHTAQWLQRTLQLPAFQSLAVYENHMLRVPVQQQRQALAAIGAPLTADTLGNAAPRRGVMRLE
ncbi:glutathione S-transferase family protein [Pseudoxanthomonas wuyuanensis]|uniref:Glutathione S-transferase n=1 Tax=Pseudoxanthomonas wuyuanensis TaxID=1073196 RepID=A0A286CX79_9GAMM|nr:glutathione S-transferase family protein [Pseudoxanthomonas wuyuanensis]KAF1720849.1 glutathione S-transferase family protein [Pseudoxanthomonas wuyuanensis]SOD50990.1 Glutathione S-transferase [Pseudoxanthomonas wuyuanensis]